MQQQTAWQCVNAKLGNTEEVNTPVLILEFENGTEKATEFFNAKRTPKGNISVKPNSNFAKLYRLTTGTNPSHRFTRANKLLCHFIGHYFYCKTKDAIDKKTGVIYQSITAISPVNKHLSDDWSSTGTLIKHRRKAPKSPPEGGNSQATARQFSGNAQAIFGQFLGNDEPAQTQSECYIQPFSIAYPILGKRVPHNNTQHPDRQEAVEPLELPEGTVAVRAQRQDESDEDFLDRVLDETILKKPNPKMVQCLSCKHQFNHGCKPGRYKIKPDTWHECESFIPCQG